MSYGFLSSLAGLVLLLAHLPTDKSVGYFRSSLRDFDSWCVLIRSNGLDAGSSVGSWENAGDAGRAGEDRRARAMRQRKLGVSASSRLRNASSGQACCSAFFSRASNWSASANNPPLGERHLEVPPGTTDNSPRFQPWVAEANTSKPRRGERRPRS